MTLQHEVVIDLTRPQRVVIPVTQEDSTRQVLLSLLNNGLPYNMFSDLASGEQMITMVEYRRADGTNGMYDTTSDGSPAVVSSGTMASGKWIVRLDGVCFTVPGWAQINVRFMTESGKLLHSFPITVDVYDTACPDESGGDPTQIESIADMKAAISELFSASMSEEAKNALLNLLAHVAYTDEHGQDYLDDLEAELFRTADLVSISAVFEQGSAVIYDTDDLDTLRQYLTVTATYEDLSEREIIAYTLSGSLEVGTSTITVSYGGLTDTFDVVITHAPLLPLDYQQVEWIGSTGTQVIKTGVKITNNSQYLTYEVEADVAIPEPKTSTGIFMGASSNAGYYIANNGNGQYVGFVLVNFDNVNIAQRNKYVLSWTSNGSTAVCGEEVISRTRTAQDVGQFAFFNDHQQLYGAQCRIYRAKLRQSGVAIRDLVPCYRKSDNVIGMYDIVNDVFYQNVGTGTFTKGGDVA